MDSSIELAKGMAINPFDLKSYTEARKYLKGINGLRELNEFCSTKIHLPFIQTVKYIILLYSSDSFLNKKPMRPLEERQIRAAQVAEFPKGDDGKYHSQITHTLFPLVSEQVFNFVFNYLVYQKDYVWSEICTLEHQILENQRHRMSISEEMKDIEKKATLTKHNKDYHAALKEYKAEFYGDHEEVRAAFDIHKTGLVTIELYAKEK